MGKSIPWSATKKQAVWDKTGGRCWYCGVQTVRNPATGHTCVEFCLDHLMAQTHGGKNSLANLVPACRRCNAKKRHRSTEEYRLLLARLGLPHFTPAHLDYLQQLGVVLPADFPCYPSVTFWFEEHGLRA